MTISISTFVSEHEIKDCLNISPANIGHETVGIGNAIAAWKKVSLSSAFKCAVVRLQSSSTRQRIVGFAASVFVQNSFANEELSHLRPGLNSRIVSSIDCGRSVVLGDSELRKANTFEGLSQIILYSAYSKELLCPQEQEQVQILFSKKYVELHSGYQLRRILFEAVNTEEIGHARSSRIFCLSKGFESFYTTCPDNTWNQDRRLFISEKEDALAAIGSVAAFIFAYTPPVFHFRIGEKQILAAALEGLTDEELSHALCLNLQTVKKRWSSAFDRVTLVLPTLLPDVALGQVKNKRGPQKRHRLLAYLRHHPEELRPTFP